MNPALAAWAVEIGLITINDLGRNRRLPLPSEFLATFIVFGALTAIGGNPTARRPAGLVAWGLVIATAIGGYEKWSNPQGNPSLDAFGTVANFLSGGSATAPKPQQVAQ